ncbi:unnamed protein product [Ilex paraguariensis]|uniref:Uncharacterized protein n=1 Tax=Ilex paraguariensis TaxID=185542 RepID=A0ABC8QNX5_9AQUA
MLVHCLTVPTCATRIGRGKEIEREVWGGVVLMVLEREAEEKKKMEPPQAFLQRKALVLMVLQTIRTQGRSDCNYQMLAIVVANVKHWRRLTEGEKKGFLVIHRKL